MYLWYRLLCHRRDLSNWFSCMPDPCRWKWSGFRRHVKNPIMTGFFPDPSICRVGNKFYTVHSTFAYFPGVPVFESEDLVHWNLISNVLDRDSQVPLSGCQHSEGIFAPTIRYHKGTWYMITTNVSDQGNFIVTAKAARPRRSSTTARPSARSTPMNTTPSRRSCCCPCSEIF